MPPDRRRDHGDPGGAHHLVEGAVDALAAAERLDHRQAATFGVAMVANDARFVESALHKIVDEVRRVGSASLVDFDIEFV